MSALPDLYGYLWQPEGGPRTLAGLAAVLWRVEKRQTSVEGEAYLFDEVRNQEQQRFLAVCLLHLLTVEPDALAVMPARAKAFELLDASLKEVYKTLDLDPKSQAFEKEQVLREVVPDAKGALSAALQEMTTLATLPAARNEFMRCLNHPPNAMVLKPFLPRDLLKGRLAELFESVLAMDGLEGKSLIAGYGHARQAIEEFERDVADCGTSLALEVLGGLAERLRAIVDEKVEQSPVSSPASLFVSQGEKKYPLHEVGASVRLQMKIGNRGPGQALEVTVTVDAADGVDLERPVVLLGDIGVETIDVPLSATISDAVEAVLIIGRVQWRSFGGVDESVDFELTFVGQSSDVPWDRVQTEDPYALEPVSEKDELVGRAEVLRELTSYALAKRMGNTFVTGQKRVGKTSIVKTLQTLLGDEADLAVVYLEGGDYVSPDASATIENLGTAICEAVIASDPRFVGIAIPVFKQALAPLTGFFGEVRLRCPKFRVLIVLDEFDELPVAVYRRGEIGNALFLTLRSLGGREYIGFVLVGGEKMSLIVSAQGEPLNKFEREQIDYFDRERFWGDFTDLIRMPIRAWGFEYSDSAIVALYDLCAGHPFFTKMVCRTLFKEMVGRRDAHITDDEVRTSASKLLADISSQSFAHFWEDGILEVGEKTEEISVGRRQVLLAFATCLQIGIRNVDAVIDEAGKFGLSTDETKVHLRDFVSRGVLVEVDGQFSCKVKLFEDWLRTYGIVGITTAFSDTDAMMQFVRREQELVVKPDEIEAVLAGWGAYRNTTKSADEIRAWLAQFGELRSQRLMFQVLAGLRFYHGALVREKLREAHGIVRRDTRHQIEPGRRKRDDFLISYLDGPGKSGARHASLYADENNVVVSNVIERARLAQALVAQPHAQALVFIDDFVGTGESAAKYLHEVLTQCGRHLHRDGLKLVFVALTGFESGRERIKRAAEELELDLTIHFCDPLTETDRVFASASRFFPDSADRLEAERLAHAVGERLVRRWPLGYSDSQAAVVFDEGCPNNSLPILWEKNSDWSPLFPRYSLGS